MKMIGSACATSDALPFGRRGSVNVADDRDGDEVLRTKRVPRADSFRGFVGTGEQNAPYVAVTPRRAPRLVGGVVDHSVPVDLSGPDARVNLLQDLRRIGTIRTRWNVVFQVPAPASARARARPRAQWKGGASG
jgi:hypothetical protein